MCVSLYVSFAEYRLFYRAILEKRPIVLHVIHTDASWHERIPCMYILLCTHRTHIIHMDASSRHTCGSIVCVCIYIHIYIHTHIHAHACRRLLCTHRTHSIRMDAPSHVRINCMYIHYIYIPHIYIYTYIYIYIHTYMRMPIVPSSAHIVHASYTLMHHDSSFSHVYTYRVAKIRIHRLFPAKEPYNYWLFCGKRPGK